MWTDPGEADTRARMALDACGAGVWSWNACTGAVVADARYRQLYGFGPNAPITSEEWLARVHPRDRDALLATVANALKTGESWREEFRILHPAQGERMLEGYGRVRLDSAGSILGLIGINLDVTERMRAETALRHSEAQLKAIVDGAVDGILTIDEKGIVRSFNRAATRLFGYTEKEVVGGNIGMLIPEAGGSVHDGVSADLAGGEQPLDDPCREVAGRRRDGSMFPLELGISVINSAGERLFVWLVRDIIERKQAEATRALLMDELNHRVKNTLGTVQAMAEHTLRTTHDPETFVASFRGRLQALAGAHNLLTQSTWSGVSLEALIREQLVIAAEGTQIRCGGPPVRLTPQIAVHLGLVLHELGTNARKYGALSAPDGRLLLTWELAPAEDEASEVLRLDWRERGGPPVTPPAAPGFGSFLIERGICHTLRGTVEHAFGPEGVTCRISLPLG